MVVFLHCRHLKLEILWYNFIFRKDSLEIKLNLEEVNLEM